MLGLRNEIYTNLTVFFNYKMHLPQKIKIQLIFHSDTSLCESIDKWV